MRTNTLRYSHLRGLVLVAKIGHRRDVYRQSRFPRSHA